MRCHWCRGEFPSDLLSTHYVMTQRVQDNPFQTSPWSTERVYPCAVLTCGDCALHLTWQVERQPIERLLLPADEAARQASRLWQFSQSDRLG